MRTRLAALAATTLFATLLPMLSAAPARADVTQPAGELCSWWAVTPDDGATWDVVFYAGPLSVVDEDDPTVVHSATVTCSILGSGGDHTAAAYTTVTSGPSTGAAVLPPTTVTVAAPLPDHVWTCTRVDVDGAARYWHEPGDRNEDGWWSPSPHSSCADGMETMDSRAEDPPQGWVLSAAGTALGEADVATPVAEDAICGLPAEVRDAAWACGAPSVWTAISLARVSGGGAVVRGVPFGWSCRDVHSGLPVTHGSALTTPDPGVTCDPPAGYAVQCYWMQVSGVLAPTTLGRVSLTGSCGGLSVTRPFVPTQGALAEQWSGAYGVGLPPWRCVSDEDTTGPAAPVWALSCNLLGGYY